MEYGASRHHNFRYTNGADENTDHQAAMEDDEQALALRWRNAILRLTENFSDAADQRDDLSPILMGALHNALERLLLRGEEDDLIMLEEWLRMEEPAGAETSPHNAPDWTGPNRRSGEERRGLVERRSGRERRESAS